jgi:hypothetical protein
MIRLDKSTSDKIDKLAGLKAWIERLQSKQEDEGIIPDEQTYTRLLGDYSSLQQSVAIQFKPLIARLIEAGVIVVSIDPDGDHHCEATRCFECGELYIFSPEVFATVYPEG